MATVWQMQAAWKTRIESDPRILRGKPCIKGTRIPVALILGYLALLDLRFQSRVHSGQLLGPLREFLCPLSEMNVQPDAPHKRVIEVTCGESYGGHEHHRHAAHGHIYRPAIQQEAAG